MTITELTERVLAGSTGSASYSSIISSEEYTNKRENEDLTATSTKIFESSGLTGTAPIKPTLTFNRFKSTTIYGNLNNQDFTSTVNGITTQELANANFKRNVSILGDLTLGNETDGTGGNILVNINDVTHTLTPTKLKYLSTITSDYATTISNFAPLVSPSFSGTPLAPTPTTDKNNTEIATTAFVKAQGYTTTPNNFSLYAPLVSPSFSGTPLAPTPTTDKNNTEIATTAFVKAQKYLTSVTPTDLSNYVTKSTAQDITAVKTHSGDINRVFSNGTFTGKVKLGNSLAPGEKGMYLHYAFYDAVNDVGGRGLIQGEFQGSGIWSPICLNPNGGVVGINMVVPNTTYSLDVNGKVNATTIYENGTLLSSKYATKVNHIYCELGGNFEPIDVVATPSLAGLDVQSDYFDATYNSVNAIVGYNLIRVTSAVQQIRYYTAGNFRNYVVSGYDKSVYGFNTLTGNWKCPQSGNYSICISFYITSNHSLNRFSLNKYNSANELLFSQYCLMEEITTDTLRPFTTILYMNKDEYFNIKLTSHSGNAVMRFEGMNYTSMKIMLLG